MSLRRAIVVAASMMLLVQGAIFAQGDGGRGAGQGAGQGEGRRGGRGNRGGAPQETPIPSPHDSSPVLADPPEGFDQYKPGVPRGRVDVFQYDSKRKGIKRDMVVYTPPGYSTETKYPVFYLLHGLTDIETEWAFSRGRMREILDGLIAEKKAVPMIVVMPSGEVSSDGSKRASGAEARPLYADFEPELLEEIMPYIESHYSTRNDANSRAILGWSMGGGQALTIGLGHLDKFAYVGGFSAANPKPIDELIPDPAKTKAALKLLWLSCGDVDSLMNRVNRPFHDALNAKGIDHHWRVDAGGHEWHVPRRHLWLVSQLLFK